MQNQIKRNIRINTVTMNVYVSTYQLLIFLLPLLNRGVKFSYVFFSQNRTLQNFLFWYNIC